MTVFQWTVSTKFSSFQVRKEILLLSIFHNFFQIQVPKYTSLRVISGRVEWLERISGRVE